MVNAVITAISLLAVGRAVGAVPTAEGVASTFSFVNWVDGIIANPDGDNLSPEAAVAAFYAATSSVQSSDHEARSLLEKRYSCNTIPGTEASVPDAVACINELARRGSNTCHAGSATVFCRNGGAQITGVSVKSGGSSSSCNDVARGAGFVMDHCTRADNTVQGSEFAYGNGDLLVWIRKPSSV